MRREVTTKMTHFDLTVRLDDEDLMLLAEAVASRIREDILAFVSPARSAPGIRVLSRDQVAKMLRKSTRQLVRMEVEGRAPRRRRISRRRVGYFAHEVDGTPVNKVIVQDERRLTLDELSVKVGLNKKTIARMARELPEPDSDNRWLERDIDDWLLGRPQV